MALSHQFHYQDWFTKLRYRQRKNHTQNLYWFGLQEDLHLVVLRSFRTSTIRDPSTNSMHMQFPKILPLPWTLQEKEQELKCHQLKKPLITLTNIKKVEKIIIGSNSPWCGDHNIFKIFHIWSTHHENKWIFINLNLLKKCRVIPLDNSQKMFSKR